MKFLRDCVIFFAGAGTYFLLSTTMDYITRRGEVVAQACVKQQISGKWTTVQCARAKK